MPLVEVGQLGGAQAGWSEEEASDVPQHQHDKHRVPRAYQSISITLGILGQAYLGLSFHYLTAHVKIS